MRLSQLLAFLPEPPLAAPGAVGPDPDITGIAYDGRRVTPGSLFVAVWHRGYASDGHNYVAQAVRNGAAAVVVSRPVDLPERVPQVTVPDTAAALGWLGAGFYGLPSQRLGIVGVTGTDGKTTTCTLTTAVLEAAGFQTGMATTVASKSTGAAQANPQHTSTPEAVEIQQLLARTVDEGGARAVLEATSHALDQHRLAGCELDVAVVTRVTHEHMEYHGTYDAYLAAKARILDLLQTNTRRPKHVTFHKAAVLNADDSSFAALAPLSPALVIPYGLGDRAIVRAVDVQPQAWGTACRVLSPWGEDHLDLQMPGEFNVYNALAALASGCTLEAPFDVALAALAAQRGVRGRMERVDAGQPFTVVVDFAHTPDSLERVLTLLRGQVAPAGGRVLVVFGSAGERDVQKRPMMGRVAAQLGDFAVFTDEDPRQEDRDTILDDIAAGALAIGGVEGETFVRQPDRRKAIVEALSRARPGDAVLLAGKGHETSIIGQLDGKLHTFPWDEHAVALTALQNLGYRPRSTAGEPPLSVPERGRG
ncbi:MAG: UDP-N-acetylmuramoylalanyl-D-glutamate--2,6-diaminopimelate ligase [uncultured Chloroflexi bacterium]|uniref:UDP-N-acetylmuramyl-tripeptide synthetase n=1 Tax=uncultured Chloroflexota bacterium TaxID=166587 RepID=A0A6J4JN84_9CHLR|nr:MAG: UDP-N-acetylmuramoylalanyl-D-glutamate--2,6-diaminopimelate ligase [uncultured Chloroflexota bacterium]